MKNSIFTVNQLEYLQFSIHDRKSNLKSWASSWKLKKKDYFVSFIFLCTTWEGKWKSAQYKINTYSHVWFAASIHRLCQGIYQLSADSKITKFKITLVIHQDIGWFYICKGAISKNVVSYRNLSITAKVSQISEMSLVLCCLSQNWPFK